MSWAEIVERGCGERVPGGLYAECGLGSGPNSRPLEYFLVDPPVAVPPGLDIINKAQVWEHAASGVSHLVIWVGESHYPFVSDYMEEVRMYGASRRIGGDVPIDRLTPGLSRMILVHPKCRLTTWEQLRKPLQCDKHLAGHDCRQLEEETLESWLARAQRPAGARPLALPEGNVVEAERVMVDGQEMPSASMRTAVAVRDPLEAEQAEGPCLYKAYELVPAEAGQPVPGLTRGDLVAHSRSFAATSYLYYPSGEEAAGLEPGIFAVLPLHGFAIVKDAEGNVDARKEEKARRSGFEWYAADK
jgi:hypothetical protein